MIKKCPVCDRKYYYDIEECIFCNTAVRPLTSKTWTVEGVTKVAVPSPEHRKAPYYTVLLRDENNNLSIRKMAEEPKIGDVSVRLLLGEKKHYRKLDKWGYKFYAVYLQDGKILAYGTIDVLADKELK